MTFFAAHFKNLRVRGQSYQTKRYGRHHTPFHRPLHGFTLVELMVVIVIIGILASLVGVNVVGRIEDAKIAAARAQIATFGKAVNFYRSDTGEYPDNSIGLDALIEPPPGVTGWNKNGYLEGVNQLPLDPWDNEYIYRYPGEISRDFDIYSLGPDAEEGGEDDIYNSDVRGRSEQL